MMQIGPKFMVGEEVLYDGRRYVVAGKREGPYGIRILAASDRGGAEAQALWVDESELNTIKAYTEARNDTSL